MAQFPALPLFTDAYLADTRHLSAEQHGAYLLLLMEAWRRPACSLPDDDEMLARLSCMSVERWALNRDAVLAFWSFDGRRKEWTQGRLTDEREYVRVKSASQRHKAAKRWNKTTKPNAVAMPAGMPDACPLPTPTVEDTNVSSLSVSEWSKAAKQPRKRNTYPDDFEAAWLAYPTTRNMSKAEALPEWKKLSADDRAMVQASIAGYRDYLKTKPTLEVIHFCRYLSKRRFEGYAQAVQPETDKTWQTRLGWARGRQEWSTSQWGPVPGHAGCRVPDGLLQPGDGVGWVEARAA